MKLFRTPRFWWCLGISLGVLSLIWAAYRFAWPDTGFQGKTVWDWLSLLIIPFALALVALFFNQVNTSTERQIALDKQREDLLQAYLDRMSELLLEKGLRTSLADAEVRNIARTRTISVLRQLDVKRVEYVFAFLREAGLTKTSDPIISLKDADLSNVKWGKADLRKVNLSRADLSKADLSKADLSGANLTDALLSSADLTKAKLVEANFSGAYLWGANLSGAVLWGASFKEAFLREADFTGAFLGSSTPSMREVYYARGYIDGGLVSGVDLTGITTESVNFIRANLKGAKIDKSKLTPEQIAQAIWD